MRPIYCFVGGSKLLQLDHFCLQKLDNSSSNLASGFCTFSLKLSNGAGLRNSKKSWSITLSLSILQRKEFFLYCLYIRGQKNLKTYCWFNEFARNIQILNSSRCFHYTIDRDRSQRVLYKYTMCLQIKVSRLCIPFLITSFLFSKLWLTLNQI